MFTSKHRSGSNHWSGWTKYLMNPLEMMMYHHYSSVSQPQLSPNPPAAWRLYCTRGSSAKWLNNYGCKALETKIYWSPSSYERDRTRKVTAVVCTCATSLINWHIPTKYGYMRICQYRTCETVVRYMCLSENRVDDESLFPPKWATNGYTHHLQTPPNDLEATIQKRRSFHPPVPCCVRKASFWTPASHISTRARGPWRHHTSSVGGSYPWHPKVLDQKTSKKSSGSTGQPKMR